MRLDEYSISSHTPHVQREYIQRGTVQVLQERRPTSVTETGHNAYGQVERKRTAWANTGYKNPVMTKE